jgi:hypothetical protein
MVKAKNVEWGMGIRSGQGPIAVAVVVAVALAALAAVAAIMEVALGTALYNAASSVRMRSSPV